MAAAAMCWGDASQAARRMTNFVGDARDDEGGSGEGDVGDDFGRVVGRHRGCGSAPGRLSFERAQSASSVHGFRRAE